MSSRENVDSIIRRMIAKDLDCNIEAIGDELKWLNKSSREDAGWFLGTIQGRFNQQLFPSFVSEDLLREIATVHGLIAYVNRKLAQD